MIELGKCYAQFCYGYGEEFVFVEKILSFSKDSYGSLGITIDQEEFYIEDAGFAWSFDESEYVEIPVTLFDELYAVAVKKQGTDTPELVQKYMTVFKEICMGKWRDIEEEDKQKKDSL